MVESQQRLSLHRLDAQTVQLEATPLMLLYLIEELLSLALSDPDANRDDFLTPGVLLDEGSEDLLLCRVSNARSSVRASTPRSPLKLEPLQIVPGYGGLQLNASKDGLIHLSRELIRILKSEVAVSHLTPAKELGAGSLSVMVRLLPGDIP